MLYKIIGGVLLLVGIVLAIKMLLGILWVLLSVAVMGALIYFGWRLLSRD